jgi:FkbH-like protein
MQTSLEVVERFLTSATGDTKASAELVSWLNSDLKMGKVDQIRELLPRIVVRDLDYTTASALHRLLKKIRAARPPVKRTPKIAVLGSMTTHQLVELLDLYLQAGRVTAEFYEADYGMVHQEFLDHESGLHQFRPDFIVILTSWRDLSKPSLRDGYDDVRERVHAEVIAWSSLWRIAREDLQCQVVQSNFVPPPWRSLGNLEANHPAGFARYVTLVNQALSDAAPSHVVVHDVDQLAGASGRWEWADERFYHHAKLPCAPEHLVDYAHSLASLILPQVGVTRKCLVLDLDNTLWGGVIGDDGLGGIRLGQGDPESESYLAFQHYVKSLSERGVILAVCSKNTDSIAREVFERHPEMVLRLDDIACFVANWDDKATNLGRISEQLNIGLNSLVFFDDNPAERAIVRQLRPDVAVPEVPLDPAYFIRALDRHRYFEALTISTEDLKRTQSYVADSKRQILESSISDLDAFLQSLEMVARIDSVTQGTLERTVQLINRSNQFNLTTRRYSSAEVMQLFDRPEWILKTVSLTDRFGDTGLISVLFARLDSDRLIIDTWLMSCRVLKRGVERLLLNSLVATAKSMGARTVIGEYIATPKNGLVREHYRSLGFTPVDEGNADNTRWELRIGDNWEPQPHFIRECDERPKS